MESMEAQRESSVHSVFAELDKDNDGVVNRDEAGQYLRDVGGDFMDEKKEIDGGVASAFDRLDSNKDGTFSEEEHTRFWTELISNSLLNRDAVADWAAHSLQLPPPVVESFRRQVGSQRLPGVPSLVVGHVRPAHARD